MRRKLENQTPNVDTLFPQLGEGEVLFIGYRYAGRDSGLYLFKPNQTELEKRMAPAGDNPVTFYAVPEDEA